MLMGLHLTPNLTLGFLQEKTAEVSKKLAKEKKAKTKDIKQTTNITKKAKDGDKKNTGQGKTRKLPPAQQPSDSEVS